MRTPLLQQTGFIKSAQLRKDEITEWDAYPFSIPAIRNLGKLKLHTKVTYLVGENGSGKSTLIEAIAVSARLNPEGGSRNFSFTTHNSVSPLAHALQVARSFRRERTGYFLRAESFFNVATHIDSTDSDPDNRGAGPSLIGSYGGVSLHEQSHGESFVSLIKHRFGEQGLYILDEPEAALSVSRQFAFLRLLDEHVQKLGSQFIISTHSPILLAYPDSTIYLLDGAGIAPVRYEDTELFRSTADFLNNKDVYLRELLPEYFRTKE